MNFCLHLPECWDLRTTTPFLTVLMLPDCGLLIFFSLASQCAPIRAGAGHPELFLRASCKVQVTDPAIHPPQPMVLVGLVTQIGVHIQLLTGLEKKEQKLLKQERWHYGMGMHRL